MVIVFPEGLIVILSGVEQEFSSKHFEGHTSKRPHICAKVVLGSSENFRSSVLSCLDFSGEMMMLPAGIAKIGYLDFESLFQLWSLIKNQFSIEGTEEFFYAFLGSFH